MNYSLCFVEHIHSFERLDKNVGNTSYFFVMSLQLERVFQTFSKYNWVYAVLCGDIL